MEHPEYGEIKHRETSLGLRELIIDSLKDNDICTFSLTIAAAKITMREVLFINDLNDIWKS